MSDRELRDQVVALRELCVQLMRALHREEILTDDQRDAILSAVEERCASVPGEQFAAEKLVEDIAPTTSGADIGEATQGLLDDIERSRRLYGPGDQQP